MNNLLDLSSERTLLQAMWQSDAVKFGERTLHSGEKSEIYFDFRAKSEENPDAPFPSRFTSVVSQTLLDIAQGQGFEFDCVGGVPNAGTPFAEEMAKIAGIPCLHIGKEGSISWPAESRIKNVILCENVINTGESTKKIIRALQAYEYPELNVAGVVAILVRGNGITALRKSGIRAVSLWTATDFLKKSLGKDLVPRRHRETAFGYLQENTV